MHCNLLFDEVQPFNKGIHSTGVLALQVCDVEARNRGKSYTVGILAVIPGPRKPAVLAPYLDRAISDLILYFHDGLVVEHTWVEVNTGGATEVCCSFKLHPLLWAVLADTPARASLCGHRGHNSYIGSCAYCIFQGVYLGAMRFFGFWQPVIQSIRCVLLKLRLRLSG